MSSTNFRSWGSDSYPSFPVHCSFHMKAPGATASINRSGVFSRKSPTKRARKYFCNGPGLIARPCSHIAGCGRYPGENIHPGRPSPYSQTPNWVRLFDVADDLGNSFVRISHHPVRRPNGASEDMFQLGHTVVGIPLLHVRDNLGDPRVPVRLWIGQLANSSDPMYISDSICHIKPDRREQQQNKDKTGYQPVRRPTTLYQIR